MATASLAPRCRVDAFRQLPESLLFELLEESSWRGLVRLESLLLDLLDDLRSEQPEPCGGPVEIDPELEALLPF